MRIRSTKPEFWRSKTIAELPWDVRFVLKGLESYVDDNGVGKDDIALIAADVFPRDLSRDPRETLARLSEAISALHEAGLIARYEWDGDDLLYIDKWKDIQRVDKPNKGRFRRPDGTLEYNETVNRDSYRNPRGTFATISETLAPGTGEQGNRGTGEQTPPTPHAEEPAPTQHRTRRKTGTEIARANFAAIPVLATPQASTLVTEFGQWLGTPLDSQTAAETITVIDQCLRDGQDRNVIAAGMVLWAKSDSWSTKQIPKFITKAAAMRRNRGVGKPTEKAIDIGDLAAEIIAEMEQP